MAIMVSVGTGGGAGNPAPPGLHQGVCVDVVDMGILEVTYKGETKKQHKVRIIWQLDETDDAGKRFIVQKRYTSSLHEKSNLRKELESWRGRPFNEEELRGFDLEKLLGANAQINVQRSADGQYANVVSIVPLGKGMTRMAPSLYVRVRDRQADNADPEAGISSDDFVDDIPF